MKSPVGKLKLVANDHALLAVLWEGHKINRTQETRALRKNDHPILDQTEEQLNQYFNGLRTEFDLPLESTARPFKGRYGKRSRKFRLA